MKHTLRTFVFMLATFVLVLSAQADYYAARNGTNSNTHPYTSWATAASNIHDAVTAANNLATVWVGTGRYATPTNGYVQGGITNVVYIKKPLTLRGATGNRKDVIIDGLGTNRGIYVYQNVNTSGVFTIKDLTVSNSCDNGIWFNATANAIAWTARVENCAITYGKSGTAIYGGHNNSGRTLIVSDSTISTNAAGAINNYSSSGAPKTFVTDCIVEYNKGTVFSHHPGTHIFTRCVIRHNGQVFSTGGGVCEVYNSLLYRNISTTAAGVMYAWNVNSRARFHNSTIVTNSSNVGGALRTSSGGTIALYNSISYFNVGGNHSGAAAIVFTNSCSTGISGSGNITVNPQFENALAFDYRPKKTSPCVNSGTNLLWMATGTDLVGFRRIDRASNKVDMGCYEYPFRVGTSITVN